MLRIWQLNRSALSSSFTFGLISPFFPRSFSESSDSIDARRADFGRCAFVCFFYSSATLASDTFDSALWGIRESLVNNLVGLFVFIAADLKKDIGLPPASVPFKILSGLIATGWIYSWPSFSWLSKTLGSPYFSNLSSYRLASSFCCSPVRLILSLDVKYWLSQLKLLDFSDAVLALNQDLRECALALALFCSISDIIDLIPPTLLALWPYVPAAFCCKALIREKALDCVFLFYSSNCKQWLPLPVGLIELLFWNVGYFIIGDISRWLFAFNSFWIERALLSKDWSVVLSTEDSVGFSLIKSSIDGYFGG